MNLGPLLGKDFRSVTCVFTLCISVGNISIIKSCYWGMDFIRRSKMMEKQLHFRTRAIVPFILLTLIPKAMTIYLVHRSSLLVDFILDMNVNLRWI